MKSLRRAVGTALTLAAVSTGLAIGAPSASADVLRITSSVGGDHGWYETGWIFDVYVDDAKNDVWLYLDGQLVGSGPTKVRVTYPANPCAGENCYASFEWTPTSLGLHRFAAEQRLADGTVYSRKEIQFEVTKLPHTAGAGSSGSSGGLS